MEQSTSFKVDISFKNSILRYIFCAPKHLYKLLPVERILVKKISRYDLYVTGDVQRQPAWVKIFCKSETQSGKIEAIPLLLSTKSSCHFYLSLSISLPLEERMISREKLMSQAARHCGEDVSAFLTSFFLNSMRTHLYIGVLNYQFSSP